MKKRVLTLTAAFVLCAGVTGCGSSEPTESNNNASVSKEETWKETYVQLFVNTSDVRQELINNMDQGIQNQINKSISYDPMLFYFRFSDHLFEYNSPVFSNDSSYQNGTNTELLYVDGVTYSGEYSFNGSLLKIKHQQYKKDHRYFQTILAPSTCVKDKTESSNESKDNVRQEGILKKETDGDMQTETYIFSESGVSSLADRKSAGLQKTMEDANNSNKTILKYSFYPDNKELYATVIPELRDDGIMAQYTLYKTGNFLSCETFGISINGTYQSGTEFDFKYNPIQEILENPDSTYNDTHPDTTRRLYLQMAYHLPEGSENYDTTVHFSNGKWTWVNFQNQEINTGSYQESKTYPGLILMYLDNDSRRDSSSLEYFCQMIYIADDGKVYLPLYVRTEL